LKNISMSFNDITPNLRHINLLQCTADFCEGPRMIYDHQIVYVHKGRGFLEIDGQRYDALPGDLFFYGPKTLHKMVSDPHVPYLLTGFHFDFTQNHSSIPYPIGTFSPAYFKEDLLTECVSFTDFSGFPPHISITNDPTLVELLFTMLREFNSHKLFHTPLINGLFAAWLSRVARHISLKEKNMDIKDEIIGRVIKFIQDNYNKQLPNESIGARFNFHPNYLNQLILAHTGFTLRQYIINLRIKKAMDMLVNSQMSTAEVCFEIGYDNIHYFTRLFKKKTGFTPGSIKSYR
jgi:AraC-like DNA-binding protein